MTVCYLISELVIVCVPRHQWCSPCATDQSLCKPCKQFSSVVIVPFTDYKLLCGPQDVYDPLDGCVQAVVRTPLTVLAGAGGRPRDCGLQTQGLCSICSSVLGDPRVLLLCCSFTAAAAGCAAALLLLYCCCCWLVTRSYQLLAAGFPPQPSWLSCPWPRCVPGRDVLEWLMGMPQGRPGPTPPKPARPVPAAPGLVQSCRPA